MHAYREICDSVRKFSLKTIRAYPEGRKKLISSRLGSAFAACQRKSAASTMTIPAY